MYILLSTLLLLSTLSSVTAEESVNSKDYLYSISCDASDLTEFQKVLFQLSPLKNYTVEDFLQLLLQKETMMPMKETNKNQTVNLSFQELRRISKTENDSSEQLSAFLIAYSLKFTYLKLSAGREGASKIREQIDICKLHDSRGCHLSKEDAELITDMTIIESLCKVFSESLPYRKWTELEFLEDRIAIHSKKPEFAKYASINFVKWFDGCIKNASAKEQFSS